MLSRNSLPLLLLCVTLAGCSGKTTPPPQDNSAATATQSTDKSSNGGAQANDVVTISADGQHRVGIVVQPVEAQQIPRELTVAGQVQMDEQHTSHIGAIADGRIISVSALPGAPVRKGETLGDLHSHMVHETVGALMQAFADVDRQQSAVAFATEAQQRYHHLYSIQAASLEESQRSDQDLRQAQKMLVDAQTNVHMEREHLSELLNVDPEWLTPKTVYEKELIPIVSPIDGVVMTRNVTVGQVVATGFETFVVSNLHTVWVTASVNEKDLSLVRVGVPATVTSQGYPAQIFHGRVAMIGDMLDPQTRTVPVRIVVPNPETLLRPGMFATANISESQTRDALFVPEDALQDINGMRVVFTTTNGTIFKAKTVTVGTRSQGKVEILDGLAPEDRVVVQGAFMVKSEMLKGTMGEG
ncbi:MAG TPA: efflux RND transporter periplasmic adaptor subunit [Granulicella sp.]|nr:efflux RND transporter periplasmic adaptor subunit [Granulicella sp.]